MGEASCGLRFSRDTSFLASSSSGTLRAYFPHPREHEKERVPRDDEGCARLAALMGEAYIRMASVLIRGRCYAKDILQRFYEPGLVLLVSARQDSDRLFAERLGASPSADGNVVDEVGCAIDLSLTQALEQQRIL